MNKVIKALMDLGEWEMTSINTVADITLYIGITAHNARILVDVDGVDFFYVKDTPDIEAVQAAHKLFCYGEDNVTDLEYSLAETLQPVTGDGCKVHRFIP